MPQAAVVIATYNTACYLGEAIRSVLAQTVADLELIVVDDGSTDDTIGAVSPYLSDPRVRYIRQENRGQASAKNRGIVESKAPVVGFCDADDFWDARKLEIQLPYFDEPEVGVVYSRVRRFKDAPIGRTELESSRSAPHSGHVTETLFIENFVPFGSAMVRRACLEETGGFDESLRMGIDWDLWLRISLGWQFRFVDEITYNYRVWEQQMSQNWRGRYHHAMRIMDTFLARYPEAVSPRVVRRAWAHTFARRGYLRVSMDREFLPGIGDVARALLRDPAYADGWKTGAWIGLFALRSLMQRSSLRENR
jgi:glycosyltransferase involved in cell wall biosynthesis